MADSIYEGLEQMAQRLSTRPPRSGVLCVEGVRYSFTFDAGVPGYRFADPSGAHVVTVVGRTLSKAKATFREYVGEAVPEDRP